MYLLKDKNIMKYIKTTLEAYRQYVKDNNTDRIRKGEKLIVGSIRPYTHPLYEIKFNPKETEYNTLIGVDGENIDFETIAS